MEFRAEVPDLGKFYIETRRNESKLILYNHPTKIPVVLEPFQAKPNTLTIQHNKFLVPRMYTFHEFIQHVRRRLSMDKSQGLFLMVDGKVSPTPEQCMFKLYETYKNEDGFLYLTYSSHEVYG